MKRANAMLLGLGVAIVLLILLLAIYLRLMLEVAGVDPTALAFFLVERPDHSWAQCSGHA